MTRIQIRSSLCAALVTLSLAPAGFAQTGATTLEVGADGQVRREGAGASATGQTQGQIAPRVDVPPVNAPGILPDADGISNGTTVGAGATTPAGGIADPGSSTPVGATPPSLLTSGLIQGRIEAGTTPDTLFLVTNEGSRFLINDPLKVAELRTSLGSTISVTGSVAPMNDPNLPPGLANRETLPPGLENRETLPPGLENRAQTVNTLTVEGFQVVPPAGQTRF